MGFVLMGFAIGVTGAFIQAQRFVIPMSDFVVVIPWGTALLLITITFLTRLATVAARTRWAGWLFFTCWLAATVLLSADSPSGDLAISSGARQMVYLFGGIVLGAAAATLPVEFRIRKGTKRIPQPSVSVQ
jgi:hypothetical protein